MSVVTYFVKMLVGGVASAFTVAKLWLWFITPLGLPPLTLAHAYGLDLLVTFLVLVDLAVFERPSVRAPLTKRLLLCTAALLLGFVAHLCVRGGY